jgi:hypothetical protein
MDTKAHSAKNRMPHIAQPLIDDAALCACREAEDKIENGA